MAAKVLKLGQCFLWDDPSHPGKKVVVRITKVTPIGGGRVEICYESPSGVVMDDCVEVSPDDIEVVPCPE